MLLRWLKKAIRSWLELDKPEEITTLDVRMDGVIKTVSITGVVGMSLTVSDGINQQLITEGMCPSRERFWTAWKQFSTNDVKWEDGSTFNPLESVEARETA